MTLVEVVISTLLVGVVLIGATDVLGRVIRGRSDITYTAQGEHLAQQLMTEILNAKYEDNTLPVFGAEPDEVFGIRAVFDDVDDYHMWTSPAPVDIMGQSLPNTTGWQREVTVELFDPNSADLGSIVDLGLKRIIVNVTKNGQLITRQVAIRSDKYTHP